MSKNQFIATEEDLKELSGEVDTPNIGITQFLPTIEETPQNPIAAEKINTPKGQTYNQEVETDYQYIRQNLYTITEKSIEALNNLKLIADSSQHPRAYEVFSLLVKTIADAQRDLMEIHKEKSKISNGSDKPDVVNNNLFVGTTAQLDELLAKMTKKK